MKAMKTQNVICVLHPHVAIRDPISTFSAQIHQTPCPLLVRDIGDLRNANGIAFSYLVPWLQQKCGKPKYEAYIKLLYYLWKCGNP